MRAFQNTHNVDYQKCYEEVSIRSKMRCDQYMQRVMLSDVCCHPECVGIQAKKSLCSLLSGMRSIGVFPPAAALRVFHTSITPILHYSCEVWGYLPGDNLQITLNRFCKNILGVKLSSSNAAVAGELGQYPLIIDRKVRMLKYWIKIVQGPETRYRYLMYIYLKDNYDCRLPIPCKNWSNEVRKILIEIGQENVWHNEVIITDDFINMAKQKLIDLHITNWYNTLHNSQKLGHYRLCKGIFCHETYLVTVKSYKHRRALTCMRICSHCLEIEMGRYNPRKPRNERLCTHCQLGDIEDEYPFSINMHKNTLDYVERIYQNISGDRPSMRKYIELMGSENLCKQLRHLHL